MIKPGSAEATKELADKASAHTEIDPYPGMIQGLTLSGTFLQGRTEIAIISGQIYEKGQYLRGSDDEPSALRVAQVRTTGVTLQAGGNQYVLSYPEALVRGGHEAREPCGFEATPGEGAGGQKPEGRYARESESESSASHSVQRNPAGT